MGYYSQEPPTPKSVVFGYPASHTHATCTHASNISIQATPLAPATRKASGHPAPGSPTIPVLSNPLAPALRPQGTEVLNLGQRITAQLEDNC